MVQAMIIFSRVRLTLFCLAALFCVAAAGCDTRPSVHEKTLFDFKIAKSFPCVFVSGLGEPEKTVTVNTLDVWSWGFGPETSLELVAQNDESVELIMGISNVIEGQEVDVFLNGERIRTLGPLPKHEWLRQSEQFRLPFKLKPGANVIALRYRTWNRHGATVVSDKDDRLFACAFRDLKLEAKLVK